MAGFSIAMVVLSIPSNDHCRETNSWLWGYIMAMDNPISIYIYIASEDRSKVKCVLQI